MQGHSWGMANVSRSNDSAATWLIEAAVAPAGDGGERLLQARPLPGCTKRAACLQQAPCGSRALGPAACRHAAPLRTTRHVRRAGAAGPLVLSGHSDMADGVQLWFAAQWARPCSARGRSRTAGLCCRAALQSIAQPPSVTGRDGVF